MHPSDKSLTSLSRWQASITVEKVDADINTMNREADSGLLVPGSHSRHCAPGFERPCPSTHRLRGQVLWNHEMQEIGNLLKHTVDDEYSSLFRQHATCEHLRSLIYIFRQHVTGTKFYCSARSTHSVARGSWYFEIKVPRST